MKKIFLVLCLTFISTAFVFADTVTMAINHFVVKENPFAKDEVAIVAVDTVGNIRENVKRRI
jgi:hypothetical protein